ncbi:MAG: ABC transporter substrate-binding protein [Magnetococcales bacterium]|nr:ABC transporter substrate-binding protein [Magnetococcales bacterium]
MKRLLALILAAILLVWWYHPAKLQPPPARPLILGVVPILNGFILEAHSRGFLKKEGINLVIQPYLTGRHLFDALIGGELDLGVVGLVPLALEAADHASLRILATTAKFHGLYRILANPEAGIHTPEDLQGHLIGLTRDSSMHYFLYNFLVNLRIPPSRVRLRYYDSPAHLPAALMAGEIDAYCAREPFLRSSRTPPSSETVVFDAPELWANLLNLVGLASRLEARSQDVSVLMRGLLKAEESLLSGGKWQESQPTPWHRAEYGLLLDQELVVQLEDVVRWSMRQKLGGPQRMPNFMAFIDHRFLDALKPDAVTLIH